MRNRLQSLLRFVLVAVLRQYRHDVVQLARLEAATLYVKSVRGARQAFIAGLLLAVVLCLLLAGFLLVHAAALLYLPWTVQEKAVALLVCGLVYLGIAAGILVALTRERLWMRMTKARELVDRVMADD